MDFNEFIDSSVFKFDSSSVEDQDCVLKISFFELIKRQNRQIEQLALSTRHNIRPLETLTLTHHQVICISGEAIISKLSKCYETFLPVIAKALKGLPKIYPLQEIAWPQLLKGRSAIIIDPSDNLADLVYLPVICTHVEKARGYAERCGPLAIIICKNHHRCNDIVKRCHSFSSAGYMTSSFVCVLHERQRSLASHWKNCKILVTTTPYIQQYGFYHFKSCDSVQQIIFDGMDMDSNCSLERFKKICQSLKAVPKQVIITSKLWGTVLSEIQNDDSCSKKFLIIGSPLDLAIAANTKFNVLFTQGSHGDKLKLIFEKIKTHRAKKMLIICCDTTDMSEIRAELKSKHIGSDCVKTSRQNDELHLFEYAGKDVYFCVHRMLMLQSIDLSCISYYFVYKLFASATDRPEIESLCNRFSQSMNPDQWYGEPPFPATIAYFCNIDDRARTNELFKYLINYQWAVRCRRFWSHLSTRSLVVAIKNHLQI